MKAGRHFDNAGKPSVCALRVAARVARGLDEVAAGLSGRTGSRERVIGFLAALRRRRATLAIAGLAILLHLAASLGADVPVLALSWAAIERGRIWCVFTGSLLHLSGYHLALDVAGLLLVGWTFEPVLQRRCLSIVGLAAIASALAFLIAYPELPGYFGLSAVDHGLFAAGVVASIQQSGKNGRTLWPVACLIGLCIKCGLELSGWSMTVPSGSASLGTPVPWTHTAGVATGVLGTWLIRPVWYRTCANFLRVDRGLGNISAGA